MGRFQVCCQKNWKRSSCPFFFERKFLHGVSIGTMRVSERCFSCPAFADNGRDAGQRHFQPHRFGRLRRKQSKLDLAYRPGLGAQRKREHR